MTENNTTVETQPARSDMTDPKENPARVVGDVEAVLTEFEPPFSAFSKREKIFTLVMAGFSSFISPLSSTIYLPALNTLSSHYHISDSLINLTVTSYLIFQGIAPTIFGDFADQAGRRPAYLTAFVIYLAANIALALQNSYAALITLRMLQSAGASSGVVICMGVVADLCTTSERGIYVGLVTAGTMLGPAIAPVLGGLLTQYLGWRAIFWFLVIVVGLFLIPFTILVPETSRQIVGNGSKPARGWNLSLLNAWKQRKTTPEDLVEAPGGEEVGAKKTKIRLPNPLLSLRLIFEKDVAIVLFYNSSVYMSFIAMNTSTTSIFSAIYGFNDLIIGLCFIPMAIGGSIASIVIGKLLDFNYRRIAQKNNFRIEQKQVNDLRNYPIEEARIQIMLPILFGAITASIGYGWATEKNVPLAGPLILQFILGFCFAGILQISTTLLVDLYPMSPSTVSASNNLIRCSMGAIATSVLNPLLEAIGRGWTFTAFALLPVVLSPGLWLLVRWGPRWREARRLRIEKKKAEKEKIESEKQKKVPGNSRQ